MNIDKVKTDSYVYLHKDKETGIPFYVGKGKGKRAYSTSKRSNLWQSKVESLPNGYDVEIVKDAMSETDAYELERELIKKHGQTWNNSGTLVNQSQGGDVLSGDGLCIRVEIELPPEIAKAIEEDEEFKDLTDTEQKDFINSILPKITELSEAYKKIIDNSDEEYSMLNNSVETFIDELPKITKKYSSERISFRDFAEYFEGFIWDIEADLEDSDEEPQIEGMVELAQTIIKFFNPKLKSLYG